MTPVVHFESNVYGLHVGRIVAETHTGRMTAPRKLGEKVKSWESLYFHRQDKNCSCQYSSKTSTWWERSNVFGMHSKSSDSRRSEDHTRSNVTRWKKFHNIKQVTTLRKGVLLKFGLERPRGTMCDRYFGSVHLKGMGTPFIHDCHVKKHDFVVNW